jgi:gliding motility-associated-like protein
MRKFYPVSALLLSLFFVSTVRAQDFSNKGKDFWVGYGYHQVMTAGNAQQMVLYFAADQNTNVTISIPGNGYTQSLFVPANTVVTSNVIPKTGTQDARLQTEGKTNRGIHVTADKPVVAYAHIYNSNVSGATILYPTNTLGKEYYSINYTNISNSNDPNCWFYVVAADTGTTTVEIIPSGTTLGGWTAGNTYTVTLTQGEVYNVMGIVNNVPNVKTGVDLTGSVIRSINTGTGCKKIGVFSGSGRIAISCNGSAPSSDNYMCQAIPKAAWGKKYLTVPTSAPMANGFYRICVGDPTTVVTLNGAPIGVPLQGNFYYQIGPTNIPQLIEADKPVMVAQYITSQGQCSNGNPGDPEVIYLSPVEQNIARVLWNATPNFAITQHYINVVIPNTGSALTSFRIDGNPVGAAAWTVHPGDANYSYLKTGVTAGQHLIYSDSGFNAIAYGYGQTESYGYNAGTNIRDLFQFVSIKNILGTVSFPATCKNSPFRLSMVFPYEPTQIQWIFGALNPYGFNDTTINNPVYDSSWVVSGRTLYRYRLPSMYSIPVVGIYPIRVIATNPTPDNCGNTQEIDFDLEVFEPPTADFTFTTNGCFTSPVAFFDNSNTGGRPVISRYWNFGDATTSGLNNPTHTYGAPGTYQVKYTLVTDVGCLADTVQHPVTLDPTPSAAFTFSTPSCDGAAITFTDNSNPNGGNPITQWAWNFGDPASGPNNTSTLQNPTHTFSGPGTYTVTLQVQTAQGCQSTTTPMTVTIHGLPVADFALPTVCLPGGLAQFNDGSTFPPGETITGWDWDFGDGSPHGTVQNPSHTYSGAGPYTVILTVTTVNGCTNSVTKILTPYPEPQAAFNYSPDICFGTTATFTDLSTAAPSTVAQWLWNFGDPASGANNTSTLQNPTHNFTAPGTYTVTLNVTSAVGCQTVNNFASHQVEVHTLPTATIAGNVTVCLNAPNPDITFTGANGTAPYTFTYNINGGPNQTVTTTSGNSVTVSVPTNVAGTFVYTLVSVQESSGATCSQPQTGSSTVIVQPLPTATINGTTTVCRNAPSPIITFTGATGTAPYTFTYNINGGPNQTISTVSGNSVTIAVPTNVAGTFVYNLVGVQEGSPQGCSQPQTGSATVIVNDLPTATISGTTEVCLNATSPNITFTGAGTTPPYTFTYNINGGPNQTITTTTGNSVTLAVPTNVAGTFIYNLLNVQDGSPQTCAQNQTGSATVIVNQLPTSNFNFTVPTCETRDISFNDLSTPNSGVITTWSWNFGDPGSGPLNTSSLQNPAHLFSAAGTYNVLLTVTTDKGCVSIAPARPVTVNLRPLAGYIVPEVCLNDTYAQFTDTSQVSAPDAITAWAWNFGDPGSGPLNVSNLQNPQHSYTATGSYVVELIATTNQGCKDTVQHTLFINGSFPQADFIVQNPATLCANDSVAIADNSTVFPGVITKVEIYWDNVGQPGVFVTDNSPASGKIYKHLYPNFQSPLTRTFTIRYRAYSGGVCVNDKFRDVTVNAAPLVQFNNIPDVCFDAAPFQITQALETGGVPGSFVYSGPGITNPNGTFNPAIAGPGTHTIKYVYTSSAGGCQDSATQTIHVFTPAIANFGFDVLACEKQPVTFSDSSGSVEGTIVQWRWDFGDGSPVQVNSSGANFTHTFNTYGTFQVRLNVITNNGCVSTPKVIPVTVKPVARPRFTFPAVSCLPNATVNFTNQSTIPDGTESSFTYYWDFGDPPSGIVNNSTASNPSHTYVGTGPYSVNLQVTSGAGCVHDTTIIVNSIHPQPIADFTTDKVDVCVGGSITFTSNVNPLDGTTTSWNWDMDDGNGKTTPSFSYTYASPRVYNVSLYIYNSFNCKSNVVTKPVSVNAYPPVNAGPDKLMLEGGQVQLTPAVNASMPVTYAWTPAEYISSPTILDPIVFPPYDYTYTLTVTSDKGCSKSDKVFVKVLKRPDIPNIFSPNGDGIHDVWEIKYLDSYPGCTVDIVNRYGQLVFHSVGYGTAWDGKINGKDAPVGTYYYVVDPKNGRAKITGYVDIIR